jgi:hypothetical protein
MRVYLNSYMYDGVWDESTKQYNLACAARQSRRKQKGLRLTATRASARPFTLNFPPCTENPHMLKSPCAAKKAPVQRAAPSHIVPQRVHMCVCARQFRDTSRGLRIPNPSTKKHSALSLLQKTHELAMSPLCLSQSCNCTVAGSMCASQYSTRHMSRGLSPNPSSPYLRRKKKGQS